MVYLLDLSTTVDQKQMGDTSYYEYGGYFTCKPNSFQCISLCPSLRFGSKPFINEQDNTSAFCTKETYWADVQLRACQCTYKVSPNTHPQCNPNDCLKILNRCCHLLLLT